MAPLHGRAASPKAASIVNIKSIKELYGSVIATDRSQPGSYKPTTI